MAPTPGKDKSLPGNHRPISLLSNVSKLAEQIVLSRLRDEILDLAPIPNEKFGFCAGLSPDFQTYRLSEGDPGWVC